MRMRTSGQSLRNRGAQRFIPYLLVLPVIVSISIFAFYPFFRSVFLSMTISDKFGNPKKFVGFDNYAKLYKGGELLESLRDTISYATCICAGTFILAMVLSFLCVKPRKGANVYTTMYALPIAISSVPISAIAQYVFGRYGLVNSVLGTETIWLGEDMLRFIILVLVVCWTHVGTSFIYLLVGFRNVSQDLVEAAEIDGANIFKKFFKIYLPMASPQIFYVLFLNILTAFKSFTMIKLLANVNAKYLKTFSARIYYYAFDRGGRFEMGCVYSVLLCAVIFLFTRIQFMLEDKVVHYQ